MVHIAREPLFFSPAPAHQSLGGLCALLLKLSPQASIASPSTVYGGSSEAFAVRCLGNGHQPHVDANPLDRLALFLIGHLNSRKEKPFFVSVNQVCFSALKGQQFPVMVPADKWNLLATVKRPNAGEALVHLPRQNTRIVTDRTMLTKFPLRLLVNLVSVSHLGIQPDHHLGRQRKLIANRSVERLVHRILTKLLCFPSQFAQTITSRIGHLKRTQQGVRLLWRWLQFDLSGQFDAAITFKYRRYCNTKSGIPPFS
jgi:hypothetical protein